MRPYKKTLLLASYAVFAGISVETASAIPEVVGCQHNTKPGKFRFAAKCNKNETLVTLQTSTVVGSPGPMGPAGPAGATGPAGPAGVTGTAGATGVVSTTTFAGDVSGAIPGETKLWTLVGPTANVEVTSETQKLTGAAAGVAITGSQPVDVGICYKPAAGSAFTVKNFVHDYLTEDVSGATTLVATASVTGLAPDSYTVGFCLRNPLPLSLGIGKVNGWVMLTN